MAERLAILSIRLSHFRSYTHGEIKPDGRSVALHGPNGAGKTNLLEAVSMLVPGRGLRRAAAEEIIRRPEHLGWRVRAVVRTAAGVIEVVTGADGPENTRRSVEIDGKNAPQIRLGELIRMVWLTPAMDRLWLGAAADRRRFLDRMTLGFIPTHAEAALGYEKAMRARNRLLKEGSRDDAWLSGLEVQMARLGARITRSRISALNHLKDAQNGAETLFPKADLAILGDMETRFSEALRDGEDPDTLEVEQAAVLAARLASARARDTAAGWALDGPHRSDLEAVYAAKAMPARACSTGEQKALLLSLCLANARALTAETGMAPIVLLDEVSAHLDEARRHALLSEIETLGAQAWMTGTGPELFEGFSVNAQRFAVTETGGQSVLEPA